VYTAKAAMVEAGLPPVVDFQWVAVAEADPVAVGGMQQVKAKIPQDGLTLPIQIRHIKWVDTMEAVVQVASAGEVIRLMQGEADRG
jgi:hypothetical protein